MNGIIPRDGRLIFTRLEVGSISIIIASVLVLGTMVFQINAGVWSWEGKVDSLVSVLFVIGIVSFVVYRKYIDEHQQMRR